MKIEVLEMLSEPKVIYYIRSMAHFDGNVSAILAISCSLSCQTIVSPAGEDDATWNGAELTGYMNCRGNICYK